MFLIGKQALWSLIVETLVDDGDDDDDDDEHNNNNNDNDNNNSNNNNNTVSTVWEYCNYGKHTVITDFVKWWLLSGHTSSKGCKYDLMVKSNLFTKGFADSSAALTDSFI